MNTTKRLPFFFLLIIILGLLFSNLMPREKKIENRNIGLRVGSGDDITGLLLKEIIKTSKNISIDSIEVEEEKGDVLFDFTFKDC